MQAPGPGFPHPQMDDCWNPNTLRATMATGMLTQKMARQVHSARYPPRIGPIAVRPPAMPKNSASARPRSRSANVWTTIASAAGNMIAPPRAASVSRYALTAHCTPVLVRPSSRWIWGTAMDTMV